MSKENEKKQEQSKTEEQKKKELADAFGIDLKDIEHVFLDNGREYFKFVNPKDKTVRMIENINYNNGMDIQFKSIQHELAFTQGQNKKENAQDIFEHNSQYNNIELKLITVTELKSNRFTYNREINSLNAVNKKKLKALLKYSKQLKLKLINIENAIGINQNNEVIDVAFDYVNNKAQIKSADTITYTNTNEMHEEVKAVIDIPNETFDQLISGIDIIGDEIVVNDSKNIVVNGETIKISELVNCYNMPEIMERSDMNNNKKSIMQGLLSAIHRKQQVKSNTMTKQKQKVLVKKANRNNNAA